MKINILIIIFVALVEDKVCTWWQEDLSSNDASATYWLCGLGQMTQGPKGSTTYSRKGG